MPQDLLRSTLDHRADRAGTVFADEPADIDVIRDLARHREAQRRRNLLAAGGGALAVGGLVAALLVLPSDGSDHGAPVGSRPTSSSNASSKASAAKAAKQAAAAAAAERVRKQAAEHAAALAAKQAAAGLQKQLVAARGSLVSAPPAPKSAPLSLGLLPKGYGYLASGVGATTYGLPTTPDPTVPYVFKDKIAAVPSIPTPSAAVADYPLTVAGRPARYLSDTGSQTVSIRLRSNLTVDIQFWSNVHVSAGQALAIADSIDIRDTSHPVSG